MPPRAVRRARTRQARSGGEYKRARQVNTRPTRFDTGEFIALDGEGFSEGEPYVRRVGKSGNIYEGRRHHYAYLSASDGAEIYAAHGRLNVRDILEWLIERQKANPSGIFVVFGAGYDFAQWVIRDLNRIQLQTLLGKNPMAKTLNVTIGDFDYRLECQMRKCFTIRQWERGSRKYELGKNGKRKLTPHTCMKIWDVWGFFQGSFVDVLKTWVPDDPDYQMIKRMKGNRNIFERGEIDAIRTYNAAELRCLVQVMNKVRQSIADLGLKITRWDGAGAIAAAMMTKHKVKDHMCQPPPEVFDAARVAYSGGHIETMKLGFHQKETHHYDVNSAYPSEYRFLPSLRNGKWRKGNGVPPDGFTLVHIKYSVPLGRNFYPLFFRCANGTIIYPSDGAGWYWFPEYKTASLYDAKFSFDQNGVRIPGSIFSVIEWFQFVPEVDERPFTWVEDYYRARQELVRQSRLDGIERGAVQIYKLGYNSLYGKNAQQVGARIDQDGDVTLPSFFQLEWAGWVTAGCRAKLMAAAIQKPDAVIGFATDGIYSTAPLDLYTPKEKELGAWEYKIHDGITMVMPGVYWLHDGGEQKNFSRGFDKKEMSDTEFVLDAWRRKQETAAVTIRRLVGIGTACASEDFWKMRGDFVTSKRTLQLNGDNSKRYPVMLYKCRPDRELIDTMPLDRESGNLLLEGEESAPYPIAWADDPSPDLTDAESEEFENLEIADAELA